MPYKLMVNAVTGEETIIKAHPLPQKKIPWCVRALGSVTIHELNRETPRGIRSSCGERFDAKTARYSRGDVNCGRCLRGAK